MAAWFVPAAMALGGALSGKAKADEMDAQATSDRMMNAVETKYSPWLQPQYRSVRPEGSQAGMMLGGGMQGAMMGMGLNKAFSGGGMFSGAMAGDKATFTNKLAPEYAQPKSPWMGNLGGGSPAMMYG